MVMVAACPITVRGAEQQPKLNAFEAGAIGAVVGATEGGTGMPCNFLKNQAQLRVPFQQVVAKIVTNPMVLWRGVGTNTAFMAPITLAQFAVNKGLEQFAGEKKSVIEEVACAATAGAVPAIIAAPAERAMMFQQGTGEGLAATLRELIKTDGIRAVLRGTPATMMRDAGFVTGLFMLMPYAKEQMMHTTEDPVVATVTAAIAAGTITTCATHWVDTVKTRQFAVRGAKGKGLFAALREICREGGVNALHKGVIARNTRVALAIGTMDTAKNWLTDQYQQTKAKQ